MPETASTSPPALHVDDMNKSFREPDGPGHVLVLENVSMTVQRAEFVAIVGPSGSGKSTLMHCAAGLEVPDSGRVLIAGSDIADLNRNARAAVRRRHVGFVFQEYNLIASLTVRDNVLLPMRLQGRPASPAAADEALGRLGLGHRASHRPHQLSGGEQQRVAIARVLVSSPDIVFADEPTGALDVSASTTVMHWLKSVPLNGQASVVMVTHDPHAAAAADRVLVMGSGRIRRSLPGGNAEHIAEAILAEQEGRHAAARRR